MKRAIVTLNWIVIGECASNIRKCWKDNPVIDKLAYKKILKRLSSRRDHYVHNYHHLNYETMYDLTVQELDYVEEKMRNLGAELERDWENRS